VKLKINLINCEETLLHEIGTTALKQADVAVTYAMAICSTESESVDWARVNKAIMMRWSKGGLDRIKKMAWKKVHAK
jgi:hypothetical protein